VTLTDPSSPSSGNSGPFLFFPSYRARSRWRCKAPKAPHAPFFHVGERGRQGFSFPERPQDVFGAVGAALFFTTMAFFSPPPPTKVHHRTTRPARLRSGDPPFPMNLPSSLFPSVQRTRRTVCPKRSFLPPVYPLSPLLPLLARTSKKRMKHFATSSRWYPNPFLCWKLLPPPFYSAESMLYLSFLTRGCVSLSSSTSDEFGNNSFFSLSISSRPGTSRTGEFPFRAEGTPVNFRPGSFPPPPSSENRRPRLAFLKEGRAPPFFFSSPPSWCRVEADWVEMVKWSLVCRRSFFSPPFPSRNDQAPHRLVRFLPNEEPVSFSPPAAVTRSLRRRPFPARTFFSFLLWS